MSEQQSKESLITSGSNMCKAGAICAGISLIIGGVPLSLVGLVCVIIGRFRFSKANRIEYLSFDQRQQARRIMGIAFAVTVGALVLNAYALYAMWPVVMEIIQSGGDISSIYTSLGAGGASAGLQGATSTWG